MLSELFFLAALGALTVLVHAAGTLLLLRRVRQTDAETRSSFWSQTWMLIKLAWALIAMHLIEIAIWAAFYWAKGCLPDLESSIYFAGVTYTTIGYGDLLLPAEWRLMAPLEGLTGILMCGLSTGFFFAVLSRLFAPRRGDA